MHALSRRHAGVTTPAIKSCDYRSVINTNYYLSCTTRSAPGPLWTSLMLLFFLGVGGLLPQTGVVDFDIHLLGHISDALAELLIAFDHPDAAVHRDIMRGATR